MIKIVTMIKKLIEQKEKYFWSKSSSGAVIVGGYNDGRFYGQIEFTIDKNSATIKIDISNGVSSSRGLPERHYSNTTLEYKQIAEIFKNIDGYLNDPHTISNQKEHRAELLQNVMNLLPKYEGPR